MRILHIHDPIKSEEVEAHISMFPNVIPLMDKREVGAGSLLDYYRILCREDPNGNMVILCSDHVYEGFSLSAFSKYHNDMQKDMTILAVPPKNYGSYIEVENGLVLATQESYTEGCLSSTGTYIMKNRALLECLRTKILEGWDGELFSVYSHIFLPMVMQANVASFTLPENGYWDDTGTLQRYYRNNTLFG